MDLCKLTKLGTIGAAIALLAASETTALGQAEVYARGRAQAGGGQPGMTGEVGAHSMSFQTTKDGRDIAVEMRDNEVDSVLSGAPSTAGKPLNTVFVAESARVPESPVRPSTSVNIALGVLRGQLLQVDRRVLAQAIPRDRRRRQQHEQHRRPEGEEDAEKERTHS